MLAEWLQDIAQHIEEESPLIRDVSVDDALSDEGWPEKSSPSFNAPGRASPPEENVSDISTALKTALLIHPVLPSVVKDLTHEMEYLRNSVKILVYYICNAIVITHGDTLLSQT